MGVRRTISQFAIRNFQPYAPCSVILATDSYLLPSEIWRFAPMVFIVVIAGIFLWTLPLNVLIYFINLVTFY